MCIRDRDLTVRLKRHTPRVRIAGPGKVEIRIRASVWQMPPQSACDDEDSAVGLHQDGPWHTAGGLFIGSCEKVRIQASVSVEAGKIVPGLFVHKGKPASNQHFSVRLNRQ